jgi:hypothetical protein
MVKLKRVNNRAKQTFLECRDIQDSYGRSTLGMDVPPLLAGVFLQGHLDRNKILVTNAIVPLIDLDGKGKAQGRTLGQKDRMAPTPTSETSTSTTY